MNVQDLVDLINRGGWLITDSTNASCQPKCREMRSAGVVGNQLVLRSEAGEEAGLCLDGVTIWCQFYSDPANNEPSKAIESLRIWSPDPRLAKSRVILASAKEAQAHAEMVRANDERLKREREYAASEAGIAEHLAALKASIGSAALKDLKVAGGDIILAFENGFELEIGWSFTENFLVNGKPVY